MSSKQPIDRTRSARAISCAGCGACCLHIGTPPGFALFYPPPGTPLVPWARDADDHSIWRRLPAALHTALRRYYDDVQAGRTPDRTAPGLDLPCLWLDTDTRRCRHYAHRPTVCRQFEPGCPACLEHRRRRGPPVRPVALRRAVSHRSRRHGSRSRGLGPKAERTET